MSTLVTIDAALRRNCQLPFGVIEVGCYNADYSHRIFKMFNNKFRFYYAFECDPRNIEKISHTTVPSPFKLIPMALGSVDGEVEFYQSDGLSEQNNVYDSASSLRKPKEVTTDWKRMKFREPIKVKSITLDTFCNMRKIESIDLIFADVQGAEKDLIMGGKEILKNTNFVFLEHSLRAGRSREWYEGQWHFDEMVEDMKALGFEIYKQFPSDILFYNTKIKNVK